jgi:hypothetical protein
MSGDGSEFEYPDTAGYPDGMGTLHEGIDEDTDEVADEADDDAATQAEGDLERFALADEEDVEGV